MLSSAFLLKTFNCLFLGVSIYIGYCKYSDYSDSESDSLNNKIVYKMGANYKAFVLGGTGGIGRHVVKALARVPQFASVTLIGRRAIELPPSDTESDYTKFDQKTMDFDNISQYGDLFKGYDVGFYTIGVSSAKVNEAEFRKIELDNALALAKLIKEGECKDIHWVTGQGTNKNAWTLFGKVKAQVEEEISNLGFRRVSIYRPAGVLTERDGKLESAALAVFKAIDVCRWMSVEGEVLGKVMVDNALKETQEKVEILDNSQINKMGKKLK